MMRTTARSSFLQLFVLVLSLFLGVSVCRAESASSDTIQAMKLVANRSGWLLANNRLFWTDSLGMEWAEITPASQTVSSIGGAFFSADGKGWALQSASNGATLTLAHTTDKGAHWSYTPIASPFDEAAVYNGKAFPYFVDDQHGWIMLSLQSSSAFRRGILLQTTDGGLHWTVAPTPPVGGDLYFTDATHGWTGPGPNGDELFQTSDAGQTWQTATLPLISAELSHIHSTITLPTFTDAAHGTLLRTYLGDQGATVVRYDTADAGATWNPATTSAPNTAEALAADGTLTPNLTAAAKTGLANVNAAIGTLTPIHAAFSTQSAGWVLFAGGKCQPDQGLCTQTKSLKGTLDGGQTFFALGQIPGLELESTQQTAFSSKNSPQSLVVTPDSSSPVTGVMGFDACSLATVAQLQTWWTSSPYKTVGVYIGGDEFACSSGLSSLTPSYVSSVLSQGWEIVPIWVGPQGVQTSTNFTYTISSTPATANAQGVTEADSAVAAMISLGMGQGSTIAYDMEAYAYTVAANVAATQAFIEGWTTELHAKGYLSAVYSGHNEFDNWTPSLVTPAIDTIWFTYFFSNGVACGARCETVYPTTIDLSTTAWLNHHRSRQTSSGFNSTYGGLTLNIDEDYTDAAFEVATPNTLTAAKAGAGTGTIATTTINNSLDTSIDTAISCGPSCTSASANFAATDTVTLTATPASGSVFLSWSGCTSVSGVTCTVATTASTTVTATFNPAPTYTLTVAKAGTGTGTVKSSDTFISCGTTCSASYIAGISVTLTATPAAGSLFGSWSGCTTTSGTTCNVTTGAAPETVTATFNPAPTFSAALSATTLSIVGGQTATDTLTISPQVGYTGNFTSLSCTGLPSSATCAFNPTTFTALGDGAKFTSTVTITTIPVFTASVSDRSTIVLAGLMLPALLLPWVVRRRKGTHIRGLSLLIGVVLSLGLSQLLTGCTAGNPAPYSTVPPGVPFSGTINVTFTSATGVTQLPIQLAITSK